MMRDPAHGDLAPYLVRGALYTFAQLSSHNRIQCEIPAWLPESIKAILSNGFEQHYESIRMGT